MGTDASEASPPEATVISNRFIRTRNVLLSEVDCGPLFRVLDAHRERNGIEFPERVDAIFRALLAAFTLHCAARPRNEVLAWTVRYGDPVVSLFFGGDTEVGSVVGRYFDQHVKKEKTGEFHQELHRLNRDPHISMVPFSGTSAREAVHEFYQQSEQRPAYFFDMGGDHYALASAHPDYDEGWFTHLDIETIRNIDSQETVNLLETRSAYWLCGCSEEKIYEMLTPVMKRDPAAIFGDSDSANVNCPRCNANYRIDRDALAQRASSEG